MRTKTVEFVLQRSWLLWRELFLESCSGCFDGERRCSKPAETEKAFSSGSTMADFRKCLWGYFVEKLTLKNREDAV